MRRPLAPLGFLALVALLVVSTTATSSFSAPVAFASSSVPALVAFVSSVASVPLALVALAAVSSLGGGLRPLRPFSPAAAPVVSVSLVGASLVGVSSAESWNPDLVVRPTGVGSPSQGRPFTILGEAGASVRGLRLYRNRGKEAYLRGIVTFFSDGSEIRAGVRKDQFSELTFSEGEVITSMTLWTGSSSRVARIDVTTSQRSWGYGVENTAKLSAKAVNVGSGVLVGFQGRAGDDLDQVAPIFLKTLSDSVVDNVVFEKVGGNQGLRLVTLREGTAVWDGTDYSWNFAGTESRDASTTFTSGSSNDLSLKTTFSAALPRVMESGIDASWGHGQSESHEQKSGSSTSLSWSTTIALSAENRAVSCSAMVWEGRLNVRWSGSQTVVADGASVSFPVSGTLAHVSYGKVETVCRPMSAPASSRGGSGSAAVRAKRWAA